MREIININSGWTCTYNGKTETVKIPHTPVILPLHYFSQKTLHLHFTYEKKLDLKEMKRKNVTLIFEGISSYAKLFVNGKAFSEHRGAYLPFKANLTDFAGTVADIRLECSSEEDPDIPPFGGRMDYLAFCGMYREARLLVTDIKHIESVRVSGDADGNLSIRTALSHYPANVSYSLYNDKNEVFSFNETITEEKTSVFHVNNAKLWSVDEPNLYKLKAQCFEDCFETVFGFRTCSFRADAFYLNGKMLKIIGANRHQSYPYSGYAMPGSFQREDARKLKEMGMNLVRCSHYPCHPDFLDECDRLGLLVFEEIPGWQHISKRPMWRELTVRNTKEMIERDYNHPSIVLWGVRINESPDDDELYEKTNLAARKLDSTRQTGGVRCIRHSHLLEDVYTFNDFSHMETNDGFLEKSLVTDPVNPYLITEFGGHVYPTKRYDDESKRLTHALRTAKCVNHMLGTTGISGCIAWCFSDYNTHEDFGSGDMICYHGLTDSFRIPKLAYYLYRSQREDKPVMALSSFMNPGDHTRLCIQKIAVFTNADYIRISNNGRVLGNFYPDRKDYPALKHPPVIITDDLIYANLEGTFLSEHREERLKFAKLMYGYALTSWTTGMEQFSSYFNELSEKYGVSIEEINRVFGTCGEFYMNGRTVWSFEAFKDGKKVLEKSLAPGQEVELKTEYDSTPIRLDNECTYQVRQVNLLAVLKGTDMAVPYLFEPFSVETEGSVELYGSQKMMSLEGGAAGIYVRTSGIRGIGTLKITSERFGVLEVSFNVL